MVHCNEIARVIESLSYQDCISIYNFIEEILLQPLINNFPYFCIYFAISANIIPPATDTFREFI